MKPANAALLAALLLAIGFSSTVLGRPRGDFHGGVRGGFHGGFHRGYGGFRGGVFFGPSFYNPFWYDPFWSFYYPGGPYYYSPYYYRPYYYPYYYPAYPDRRAAPEAQPSLPQGQGSYYCSDPRGYYPSVKSCNTPWQRVPAGPSP